MVRIVNLRVIMLLGRGTKRNAGINLLKHINEESVKQKAPPIIRETGW